MCLLYLDEEIEMQLNWITSPRYREIIDKYSRMNACNAHPGLARAANESNRQNCMLICSGHTALWFIGERRTNGGTARREQERKKRQSRSQHARTGPWSHPSKPNRRLREGEIWIHDNAISEFFSRRMRESVCQGKTKTEKVKKRSVQMKMQVERKYQN